MLISGRQAREAIEAVGVSPRSARRLLASGLAGVPTVTRAAHLYEEDTVQAVARRATLPWREMEASCPAGVFISRRDVDLTAPREQQLEELADGWALCPWEWLAMSMVISRDGSLPFIATVAGFVALGADIVGLRSGSRLLLRQPGTWFSRVEGRRLPTGPGRPWVLHLGPLT